MLNVALQVFSFEQSRRVLHLFRIIEPIVEDFSDLKFVFNRLDGSRQSIPLRRILDEVREPVRFGEGYVQLSLAHLRQEWRDRGVTNVLIHFSVSPSSEVWERLSGLPYNNIARNIFSVERAAAVRGSEMEMPTVIELTFQTDRPDTSPLLSDMCSLVARSWLKVDGIVKFATLDIGTNWLFFPKSGYNPNVADIHIYFDTEIRRDWEKARKHHNVSFNPVGAYTIHDTSLRLPAHHLVNSTRQP